MVDETTLCTCIEAGNLEEQVVLLAESLRRFGGSRAGLPLVAVRPRTGPYLAQTTKRALDRLNVVLVEKAVNSELAWWAHANKPATVAYVEAHARTPCVTWMDGDMAVVAEPMPFAPPPGFDFAARAGEGYDVASSGDDDGAEFWRQLCGTLGLDHANFPMIRSFPDDKPIRAYWQTGLFTYRTGIGFAARYHQIMAGMLAGTISSKRAGIYHTDQVAAALTIQLMGLTCALYDPRMNFNVNPVDKVSSARIPIDEVRIIHYHGALWPKDYPWARSVFKPLGVDRLNLFDAHAPFTGGSRLVKLQRKLLQQLRNPKIKDYVKRVTAY